jgi:hypothetical protein
MILHSALAVGQNGVPNSLNLPPPAGSAFQIPYLLVESDLNEDGNGYQSFSYGVTAGIDMEGRHLGVQIAGTYDFMRKTNDNDQVPNEKGRVREMDAELFYKFHSGSSWFIVGGAGWGEASMTPYMKSSWNPLVGGGHDFMNETDPWRFQVLYLHDVNEVVRYPSLVQFTPGPGQSDWSYTCSLCGNGLQGIDVSGDYPSPSSSVHWILRMSLTIDWFHETVTDPYNLSLTQSQRSQRSVSGSYTVSLIYRFKPLRHRHTQ